MGPGTRNYNNSDKIILNWSGARAHHKILRSLRHPQHRTNIKVHRMNNITFHSVRGSPSAWPLAWFHHTRGLPLNIQAIRRQVDLRHRPPGSNLPNCVFSEGLCKLTLTLKVLMPRLTPWALRTAATLLTGGSSWQCRRRVPVRLWSTRMKLRRKSLTKINVSWYDCFTFIEIWFVVLVQTLIAMAWLPTCCPKYLPICGVHCNHLIASALLEHAKGMS